MSEFTTSLQLELVDFNVITWHDQVNANFQKLDAAFALFNISFDGVWENSHSYAISDLIIDPDSYIIFRALVAHTSAAAGTFEADRLLHPTYWELAIPQTLPGGIIASAYLRGNSGGTDYEFRSAEQVRTDIGALQASDLAGYATLADPTFTGTPDAPTAAVATDNTQIATTAFVHDVVDDEIGSVVEAASWLIPVVQNKTYPLAVNLPFGATINEVTSKSVGGTCTMTFKINTTALGGSTNSVSTSEQTRAHASANVWVPGDDLNMTASANASCTDCLITIKYTRSLV